MIMKKLQQLAASSLVLAMCVLHAGCMTVVGSNDDSADPNAGQPSKAADEAVTATEPAPKVSVVPAEASAARVWKLVGTASCLELCDRLEGCNCLTPLCPGTPANGEPCDFSSPTGQCFTRPRPRIMSTFIFTCR
jgi:hypothetical protein